MREVSGQAEPPRGQRSRPPLVAAVRRRTLRCRPPAGRRRSAGVIGGRPEAVASGGRLHGAQPDDSPPGPSAAPASPVRLPAHRVAVGFPWGGREGARPRWCPLEPSDAGPAAGWCIGRTDQLPRRASDSGRTGNRRSLWRRPARGVSGLGCARLRHRIAWRQRQLETYGAWKYAHSSK